MQEHLSSYISFRHAHTRELPHLNESAPLDRSVEPIRSRRSWYCGFWHPYLKLLLKGIVSLNQKLILSPSKEGIPLAFYHVRKCLIFLALASYLDLASRYFIEVSVRKIRIARVQQAESTTRVRLLLLHVLIFLENGARVERGALAAFLKTQFLSF